MEHKKKGKYNLAPGNQRRKDGGNYYDREDEPQVVDEDSKYIDEITGAHFRYEDVCMRLHKLQQQLGHLAVQDESLGQVHDEVSASSALKTEGDEAIHFNGDQQGFFLLKTQDNRAIGKKIVPKGKITLQQKNTIKCGTSVNRDTINATKQRMESIKNVLQKPSPQHGRYLSCSSKPSDLTAENRVSAKSPQPFKINLPTNESKLQKDLKIMSTKNDIAKVLPAKLQLQFVKKGDKPPEQEKVKSDNKIAIQKVLSCPRTAASKGVNDKTEERSLMQLTKSIDVDLRNTKEKQHMLKANIKDDKTLSSGSTEDKKVRRKSANKAWDDNHDCEEVASHYMSAGKDKRADAHPVPAFEKPTTSSNSHPKGKHSSSLAKPVNAYVRKRISLVTKGGKPSIEMKNPVVNLPYETSIKLGQDAGSTLYSTMHHIKKGAPPKSKIMEAFLSKPLPHSKP